MYTTGELFDTENIFSLLFYLDTSTTTLGHGIRHSSTRRVNHRHETHKAKTRQGEVLLIGVERVALRELVRRQEIVAETWEEIWNHIQEIILTQLPTEGHKSEAWVGSQRLNLNS